LQRSWADVQILSGSLNVHLSVQKSKPENRFDCGPRTVLWSGLHHLSQISERQLIASVSCTRVRSIKQLRFERNGRVAAIEYDRGSKGALKVLRVRILWLIQFDSNRIPSRPSKLADKVDHQ
jgi:hypothetical protein